MFENFEEEKSIESLNHLFLAAYQLKLYQMEIAGDKLKYKPLNIEIKRSLQTTVKFISDLPLFLFMPSFSLFNFKLFRVLLFICNGSFLQCLPYLLTYRLFFKVRQEKSLLLGQQSLTVLLKLHVPFSLGLLVRTVPVIGNIPIWYSLR